MENKLSKIKLINHLATLFRHIYRLAIYLLGHISLIVLVNSIFFFPDGNSREISYGSSPQLINITYGGETILRFPDKVKTISRASKFQISPADKKNPDYTLLTIRPRFLKSKGKITFILANGDIIHTKVKTIKNSDNHDPFYDFIPKKKIINKIAEKNTSNISEIDLMKAMIREDQVIGHKIKKVSKYIKTGYRKVSAKLIKLYLGDKFYGHIFRIINLSKKNKFKLDLEKLHIDNPNQAILSQVDNSILDKKGSKKNTTYLRIITKANKLPRNLNISYQLEKRKVK